MKKLKSLLTSIAMLFVVATTASCGGNGGGNIEKIDYVNSPEARLKLDYKGKDFYADGIGEVKLKTCIDGDTAHFSPVITTTSEFVIKARFYGIDTPESTGAVQPYGRGASNFTKGLLKQASQNGTIVVSSAQDEYKRPNSDSTGSRYVSLVWISTTVKNADIEDLRLLNLMIVQEGWSWARNLGDYKTYSDLFLDAEAQAKALKLNLYSDEPDPLFNYGDYEDVSLLDVKREIEKQIADPTYRNAYDGKNVRVVGTVTGYSNNTLYLQNFYTKEEGARYEAGEYAGINVYTSASGLNKTKFTTPGAYLQICGVASDSETFGFQISGCSFPSIPYSENDCKVLIRAEDNDEYPLHVQEYTATELSNAIADRNGTKRTDSLFGAVKITTRVKVDSYFVPPDAKVKHPTLSLSDAETGEKLKWKVYVPFNFKPDAEGHPSYFWTTKEEWENDNIFEISGVLIARKTSNGNILFQINPRNNDDLKLISSGNVIE